MGLTRFSGPVLGAKATLCSIDRTSLSSGASTAAFVKTVVPAYEDWFVTDIATSFSTNSSNAQIIYKAKIAGTVSNMLAVSAGASTVGVNVVNTVGSKGGSSGTLGFYVPTGSTIYAVSTSVNPIALFTGIIHGWRQWVNVGNLSAGGTLPHTDSTRSFGN